MLSSVVANEKFWEDRRSHSRVCTELTLEYRIIGEDGRPTDWNVTMTKNVSAAGVYFESYYPLGLNTILEVKLNAASFKTPMMLKARVVRAEEIQIGEVYGVAAAIMHVTESYRKQLQQALEQIDVSTLLQIAFEQEASDVYLSAGAPPLFRKAGELIPDKSQILTKKTIKKMIFSILTKDEIKQFHTTKELRIADIIAGIYNFRLTAYLQDESVEANFHLIKTAINDEKSLILPESITSIANKHEGLVVIAGNPRSGKTTIAYSLLKYISQVRTCIIMSVEDTIEYELPVGNGIMRQIQVDLSYKSYTEHVRMVVELYAPEVLMVRNIFDEKTFELCLHAAANNCLVIVEVVSSSIAGGLARLASLVNLDQKPYIMQLFASSFQLAILPELVTKKGKTNEQVLQIQSLAGSNEVADKISRCNFNITD